MMDSSASPAPESEPSSQPSLRKSLRYAVSYWWKAVRAATPPALETVGWHQPRNAIISGLVALAAVVLVWLATRDAKELEANLLMAGAVFATLLALLLVAFVWQLIATLPRIDADRVSEFGKEIERLKLRVEELASTGNASSGLHERLTALEEKLAGQQQANSAEKRLEHVRAALLKHLDEAPKEANYTTEKGMAWCYAAEDMARNLAPSSRLQFIMNFHTYADFTTSIASLRTFAAGLRAHDLGH